MKTQHQWMIILIMIIWSFSTMIAQEKDTAVGYIIRHDTTIQKDGPAPHHGTGTMTESIFFDDIKEMSYSFRKTALHAGASIGRHKQETDEVYYFLSGTGIMGINDKEIPVKAGDAFLTRAGSTHECRQTGSNDLVIIVVYEKVKKK